MRVCVKAATKTRKSERGTEFSIPLRILRVHCLIATPLPRTHWPLAELPATPHYPRLAQTVQNRVRSGPERVVVT